MTRFPYALLILDFDGTMGDTQSLIVKTMRQTIREMGFAEKSPEEYAATIGLPLAKCFETLFPIDEEMSRKCAETYRRIFDRNNIPGAVSPFAGVVETIRQLHEEGVTTTIASSRGHASVERYVREMHLDDCITYILGADDVEQAKPQVESVLRTLYQQHTPIEKALVVGDTKYDIFMGSHAGVATCGVTYGNGSREELETAGADYVIDSFPALLDITSSVHQTNS